MSNYKNTFNTKKMPQRIAFYDGVKSEKNCQKLLDLNTCENLVSQNIKEYKYFLHNSDDKELHWRSLCKITPAKFETVTKQDDYWHLCTPVKPTGLFTTIEASDAFDGRYPFTISRYNENEGGQRLGNGYIEINNGIMTVAKDGRTLEPSSIDLYDSFEGQIDKKGNIMSLLKINIMFGETQLYFVNLTGSIDSQFQGKWGDSNYDVILKLGKKE